MIRDTKKEYGSMLIYTRGEKLMKRIKKKLKKKFFIDKDDKDNLIEHWVIKGEKRR